MRRRGQISGAGSHDHAFDVRRPYARADVSKTAGRCIGGRVSHGVGAADIERHALEGFADLMGVAGSERGAAACLGELAEAFQV